jgi:hypothetical protein
MDGWTDEQEQLLITWAEKSSGYAWLHTNSVNYYRQKNMMISIPASLFGYIAGSVTLISRDETNNWKTVLVGLTCITAGILTSLQEVFTFKQLSEQHKISGLQFMRFFRDISVELSMHPEHRVESLEYINLKRLEFDKMLEQSPPYPPHILNKFNIKFKDANVHKPDIANKLQTIIPYRRKTKCLNINQLQIAHKYFDKWRIITIKNRKKYTFRRFKENNLVEVANSDVYDHKYLNERNLLSSKLSISSNESEQNLDMSPKNRIIRFHKSV